MFNQDFIMRQVQQMTQVLNRILSQVLRIKNQEVQADTLTYLDQALLKELGFDLDEILAIENEEELLSFLKQSGLNSENLNILADILFEVAESKFEDLEQHSKSLTLFSQSLFLYEFLEKSENIYSIDRNVKISKIRDVLSKQF